MEYKGTMLSHALYTLASTIVQSLLAWWLKGPTGPSASQSRTASLDENNCAIACIHCHGIQSFVTEVIGYVFERALHQTKSLCNVISNYKFALEFSGALPRALFRPRPALPRVFLRFLHVRTALPDRTAENLRIRTAFHDRTSFGLKS